MEQHLRCTVNYVCFVLASILARVELPSALVCQTSLRIHIVDAGHSLAVLSLCEVGIIEPQPEEESRFVLAEDAVQIVLIPSLDCSRRTTLPRFVSQLPKHSVLKRFC